MSARSRSPASAHCATRSPPTHRRSTRPASTRRPKSRRKVIAPPIRSVGERVGAELEVDDQRLAALAAFLEPRRAVAAGGPQAAALPAGIGIVDAAVEALGVEAQRIGHPQHHHLAVLEREQTVIEIAGRDRHVIAEAEGVVLVDPGIIARLGAVLADAGEAGAGILIE